MAAAWLARSQPFVNLPHAPGQPGTQLELGTQTALPPGWTQTVDPATGGTYYYNASTQESSWVMPTGSTTATVVSGTPAYSGAAPAYSADAPAQITATAMVPGSAQAQPISQQMAQPMAEPLPAGWAETTDPNTQRVYFYNAATGETVWERPTGGISKA